jgi:hypothetical protein
MSLEFEYRRLAAACLELAKRAAVLADKTRLLLIAEAWLSLADRVARNHGKAEQENLAPAEPPRISSAFGPSEPASASAAPGRHSREPLDTTIQ